VAVARTPRAKWIEEGLRALSAGGPDAVRIELLARSLGVTKGGFYGYFGDRRALLDEMLDTWERRSTDKVIDRAEREGGDAMTRARRAAELTFSDDLLPIDLAVRDWSRRDAAVAERLRRVDNRRMEYLRTLLGTVCADEDELEARCLIAFSVAIASHLIAAEHGSRSRADVRQLIRRRLFAQYPPGVPSRSAAP
jgi:AcrR family transcriptional regulator